MDEMKFKNFEQEGKSKEEERRIFIEEIEKIKKEDFGRRTPAHLFEVDPQELTIEDAEIWQKVKDGSIVPENLKRYDAGLKDEKGELRKDILRSRLEFRAFIANKANVIFLQRQIQKRK